MNKLLVLMLLLLLGGATAAQADTLYQMKKSYPATLTAAGANQYQCSSLDAVLQHVDATEAATLGKPTIQFTDDGATTASYTITIKGAGDYYLSNKNNITMERTGAAPVEVVRGDGVNLLGFGYFFTARGLHFKMATFNNISWLLQVYAGSQLTNCVFEGGNNTYCVVSDSTQNPAEANVFTNCVFRNHTMTGGVEVANTLLLRSGHTRLVGCEFYNNYRSVCIGHSENWGVAQVVFENCKFRDTQKDGATLPYGVLMLEGYCELNNCEFLRVPLALHQDWADTAFTKRATLVANNCTLVGLDGVNPFATGAALSQIYSHADVTTSFTLKNCKLYQPQSSVDAMMFIMSKDTGAQSKSRLILDGCLVKCTATANSTRGGVRINQGGNIELVNTVIKGFFNNVHFNATAGKTNSLSMLHCVMDKAVTNAVFTNLSNSQVKLTIKNSIFTSGNKAGITLNNGGTGSELNISHNVFQGTSAVTGTSPFQRFPGFVDEAGDDYHLTMATQCANLGATDTGVAKDVDGQSRPLPAAAGRLPDIGIDEIDESPRELNAARHWSLY